MIVIVLVLAAAHRSPRVMPVGRAQSAFGCLGGAGGKWTIPNLVEQVTSHYISQSVLEATFLSKPSPRYQREHGRDRLQSAHR